MSIKQYRVICWQPSTSRLEDEIFVDIAPRFTVIHNMMFYSRLKLFRGNDPHKNIVSLAGSVYLNDIDGKNIDIDFSQRTDVARERLIPLILDAYHKMCAEGKETTLSAIIGAAEAEQMADEFRSESAKRDAEIFEKRERARRQIFALKHSPKDSQTSHFPQTPQEERILQNNKELIDSVSRKQNAMIERANRDAKQDPIARMKEKMKQYSGD